MPSALMVTVDGAGAAALAEGANASVAPAPRAVAAVAASAAVRSERSGRDVLNDMDMQVLLRLVVMGSVGDRQPKRRRKTSSNVLVSPGKYSVRSPERKAAKVPSLESRARPLGASAAPERRTTVLRAADQR